MIDYGVAPAADEIELTLFGPGYGEAIAVHLGEQAWLLVDSCIDPDAKKPASLAYLQSIGVNVGEHVRAVVASHWHDDHVGGMAELAEACANAEFFISAVLNDKEAEWFLAGYSGSSAPGQARGTRELFNVMRSRQAVNITTQRSLLLDPTLNGRKVSVTALSPTPAATTQFIAHMADYMPGMGKPVNHAPDIRPNLAAIALHIDFDDDAILLGADLEEHRTMGWSAVTGTPWVANRKQCSAYKVAHHGSITGDCEALWNQLLAQDPVSCLTPFVNGNVKLPTDADRTRVKGRSSEAYISSNASKKPQIPRWQLDRLNQIGRNITPLNNGFGAVRLRKKLSSNAWNATLFGRAAAL